MNDSHPAMETVVDAIQGRLDSAGFGDAVFIALAVFEALDAAGFEVMAKDAAA